MTTCAACGASFEQRASVGRPRRYCYDCTGSRDRVATDDERARAFRQSTTPEYEAIRNARRREHRRSAREWILRGPWRCGCGLDYLEVPLGHVCARPVALAPAEKNPIETLDAGYQIAILSL